MVVNSLSMYSDASSSSEIVSKEYISGGNCMLSKPGVTDGKEGTGDGFGVDGTRISPTAVGGGG